MDFTQSEMSKTSQSATGGKSISQEEGKSESFWVQYILQKVYVYILMRQMPPNNQPNQPYAPCDTGEEKNFQIPKPELRLKHTWEFIFKEIATFMIKAI